MCGKEIYIKTERLLGSPHGPALYPPLATTTANADCSSIAQLPKEEGEEGSPQRLLDVRRDSYLGSLGLGCVCVCVHGLHHLSDMCSSQHQL
jgi:hypothetical protein